MGRQRLGGLALPDGFWLRSDVRDSLAERDFGALFRLVSKYAGASQTQIAIAVIMTQGQISGYMAGKRQVLSIEVADRVLDGLNAPDSARLAFGLAPRNAQPSAGRAEPVIRAVGEPGRPPSAAAHDTAPVTKTMAFPLPVAAVGTGGAKGADDSETLRFIDEALAKYADAASIFGGQSVLELAERSVRMAYLACETSTSGKTRRQAMGISARYAEFLGWLYQDFGHAVRSLFWTDRALEWAQEADVGPQFISYVWMRKADHAEHFGTADSVVTLSRQASAVGALSPLSRALAAQQEARGHSQSRDSTAFERKVDEARTCVQEAHVKGDLVPWGSYCDLAYIAMQEATGYMELGRYDTAIEILERELPRLSMINRADSLVYRARLARSYAHVGDEVRAREIATTVREGAEFTGSVRALNELADLNRVLYEREQGRAMASSAVSDSSGREVGN